VHIVTGLCCPLERWTPPGSEPDLRVPATQFLSLEGPFPWRGYRYRSPALPWAPPPSNLTISDSDSEARHSGWNCDPDQLINKAPGTDGPTLPTVQLSGESEVGLSGLGESGGIRGKQPFHSNPGFYHCCRPQDLVPGRSFKLSLRKSIPEVLFP
jgi:hypothetical protein